MKTFWLITSLVAMHVCCGTTRAGAILNFVQSGADVVGTVSGSVNLTALSDLGSASNSAAVWPSFPIRGSLAIVGPTSLQSQHFFKGISGPSSLGSGARTFANSGSGTEFGLIAGYGLYVATGSSGVTAENGTSTWNNKTLAGLGLTPGVYNYTWGTGATADTLTVNIGQDLAETPEPGTIVMAGFAIVFGMGAWARKRRRSTPPRHRG